jgi:EmrB/QacA subfamily drug resistance transporter
MTDLTASASEDSATKAPVHATGALVLICVAQLMVVLDSTIANIALPKIQASLNIDFANLSWIVTGYALAFGGLLLLGGRLGDLYGRRRIFMIGVGLFAVASAVGGIAQNEAMLLGSRGVQGLAAALASPSALALITTTFPAGPLRNRAFSIFAAMAGIGAAIGLVLGGWLTDLDPEWGWRLTFLINVPIGLGAAWLAPRLLTESERHEGWLDVPGAIIGTSGLLSLVFGITRTGNTDPDTIRAGAGGFSGTPYGWGDPLAITFMALGVALLVAFVILEKRVQHPIMSLKIFASRNRAVAFVSMMITPAAMFAMFYFLSLFVQNVMGYSPLKTGFAFLPFTVGMIAGATGSSKLIAKVDPKFITGVGTLLAGLALFMFHQMEAGSVSYWTDVMPWIVVMSLGMGLTFVPMTLVSLHGIPTQDAGSGSGVLNTMQQVGGALGLAVLSTVAAHFTLEKATELGTTNPQTPILAFAHGATTAFLVGACMIWTASGIVWLLLNVKHEELAADADSHPEMAGVA